MTRTKIGDHLAIAKDTLAETANSPSLQQREAREKATIHVWIDIAESLRAIAATPRQRTSRIRPPRGWE